MQTQSEYVINTPKSVFQNFLLTDANYTNLPVYNATLKFEAESLGDKSINDL